MRAQTTRATARRANIMTSSLRAAARINHQQAYNIIACHYSSRIHRAEQHHHARIAARARSS